MKKILITLLLSSFVTSGFTYADSAFDGLYAGFKFGGTQTLAENELTSAAAVIDNFIFHDIVNINAPVTLKRNSFIGELYLGYGAASDYWYLGGELFVDWAKRNREQNITAGFITDNQVPPTDVILNLNHCTSSSLRSVEFGLDLKPGVLLARNMLFYGRAGVVYNRPALTATATQIYNDTYTNNGQQIPKFQTNSLSLSNNKNIWAPRFGMGMEHKINAQWGISLDYIYTYYKKISVSGAASIATANGTVVNGLINRVRSTAQSNAILLGLTYNFASPIPGGK